MQCLRAVGGTRLLPLRHITSFVLEPFDMSGKLGVCATVSDVYWPIYCGSEADCRQLFDEIYEVGNLASQSMRESTLRALIEKWQQRPPA